MAKSRLQQHSSLHTRLSLRKILGYGILIGVVALSGIHMLFEIAATTTYTTIGNGNWNTAGTWDANGVPPLTLPRTDSIKINHTITLDVTPMILGVMVVESSASVTSAVNQDLKIGKGGTDLGELINYGSITVDKIEVKPDNGCIATLGLPTLHNYSTIDVASLHIGNNCGAGSFFNYTGGTVTVTGDVHLDNYLYNEDTMYVQGTFKNHGGAVEGCGYIETSYLDIDVNSGRPGTFECIDICQGNSADPTINVDGTDYADLSDAYTNAPSSEVSFDDDSTLICGLNQAGNPTVFPITLVSFNAIEFGQAIRLDWITTREINNEYFTVERSTNATVWEERSIIIGAGNSLSTQTYSYIDDSPHNGTSYYRMKQTDFDGQFTYSKVVSIDLDGYKNGKVSIYPNPTADIITVKGTPFELMGIRMFNSFGKEITGLTITPNLNASQVLIDLSQFVPGVYMVKTKTTTTKLYKL